MCVCVSHPLWMSLWPVAMETEHQRRPWGLVNTHTLEGEMDGVSPSEDAVSLWLPWQQLPA